MGSLGLIKDFNGLGTNQDSLQSNFSKLDAAVSQVLSGSKTHNFGNLADGAGETTTVTVAGAALGDFVTGVSLNVDLASATLTGYVSAANTVTVRLQNESGAGLDLASATLSVLVRKA